MSVSINPPKTPVTEGSKGVAAATLPNVCKMPGPPAPFVPAPLPNIGKSDTSPKDYSKDVTIEGKKVAIKGATFKSMGDIASKGTGGGLISANCEGITSFVGPGSMNVKIEGKNVQLLGDPMLNNCGPSGSPANAATLVGVLQATGLAALFGDELCPICGKAHGKEGKLEENADTKGAADDLKAAADKAAKKLRESRDKRVAKAKSDEQKRVNQKYNAEMKKINKLRRDLAAAPDAAKAKIQAILDSTPEPVKDEVPADFGEEFGTGDFATMIGVVQCKTELIFAGQSGIQIPELQTEMKDSWHRVAGPLSKGFDVEYGTKHVNNADVWREEWERLSNKSVGWNERVHLPPKTKESKEAAGEPFYPPGQCAAQQLVVLALDHESRPVGLTERAYSSSATSAAPYEVFAHARAAPSAAPEGGWFAASQAVPPCGTCQVILTMLMCPDGRPTKCVKKSLSKTQCGGC